MMCSRGTHRFARRYPAPAYAACSDGTHFVPPAQSDHQGEATAAPQGAAQQMQKQRAVSAPLLFPYVHLLAVHPVLPDDLRRAVAVVVHQAGPLLQVARFQRLVRPVLLRHRLHDLIQLLLCVHLHVVQVLV